MITNATLTRIDTPQPADAAGVVSRSPATVSVRVALAKPTREQLITAQATNLKISAMLYVPKISAGNVTFAENAIVAVKLDGDAAAAEYWVRSAANNVKAGGLSHWELGLEAV